MGADLILATVEIRETEPECQARLARMTFTEADMTRLEYCGSWLMGEEWDETMPDKIRELLKDAINTVYNADGRDVSGLVVDGDRSFVITGGTSWGDDPSAEWDDFNLFREFLCYPYWEKPDSDEVKKWLLS